LSKILFFVLHVHDILIVLIRLDVTVFHPFIVVVVIIVVVIISSRYC
jgi:hypothetical protein